MTDIKFFLCPMSKNIVDAVLQLNCSYIGLLPSRRQIDFDGGYVGWTTRQFSEYVNNQIVIQRDHGGRLQGKQLDDGILSYSDDALYLNLVHIDPWKSVKSIEEGIDKTIEDIMFLHNRNPNMRFEVSTEEVIFPVSSDNLFWIISKLKDGLPSEIFALIEYVVIQSGVKLDLINERNTGKFSFTKLKEEISICNFFGKKSKEHNGDFLTSAQRKLRFDAGLTTINIGPELSIFENKCYIENFSKEELENANNICMKAGYWKKWAGTNSINDYFRICGHYNYDSIRLPNIDVVSLLKTKILEMVQV